VNYYERHIGDYLKDTAHLSLLEHGVYGRLLDVYYTRECGIEDGMVARLIGARSKDEISAMNTVLNEFFVLQAGVWTQSRCDAEIERYQDKQRKASASANARWKKNEPHTGRNANASPDAMRTHSEGNAPNHQTPDTRHQKRNTSAVALPPDGVSDSVWTDFLKVRKAKKAPMTDTALDGIRAEAEKAGLTLQEALQMCCARGWQGFKAAWLDDQKRGGIARTIAGQRLQQAQDFAPGIAASPLNYIDEVKNVPAIASR